MNNRRICNKCGRPADRVGYRHICRPTTTDYDNSNQTSTSIEDELMPSAFAATLIAVASSIPDSSSSSSSSDFSSGGGDSGGGGGSGDY
jgi:hypothetical protein